MSFVHLFLIAAIPPLSLDLRLTDHLLALETLFKGSSHHLCVQLSVQQWQASRCHCPVWAL